MSSVNSLMYALSYNGARLSLEDKWLVMDDKENGGVEFIVYQHKAYAKKTTELYRGTDEILAVDALVGNVKL